VHPDTSPVRKLNSHGTPDLSGRTVSNAGFCRININPAFRGQCLDAPGRAIGETFRVAILPGFVK
jgi:hypothetical protein